MADGGKIFVRASNNSRSVSEITPLYHELRCGRANDLLLALEADDQLKAGTVEMLAPGFIKGYVSRLGGEPLVSDVCAESWALVSANTLLLRASAAT